MYRKMNETESERERGERDREARVVHLLISCALPRPPQKSNTKNYRSASNNNYFTGDLQKYNVSTIQTVQDRQIRGLLVKISYLSGYYICRKPC